MSAPLLLSSAALGVAMGVLTGMGIGGGKLLVPVLVLTMGVRQQAAQAVTLAAFVPIALVASWVHARAGRLERGHVWGLAPWIVIGAAGGAWVANRLDATVLGKVYALFLLAVGLFELRPGRR